MQTSLQSASVPTYKPQQVGIYDSGMGGLTVAKAIATALPGVQLSYFADYIHLPYGNKSRENIIAYSVHNATFLKSKGADLVVVACNTSTAVALPVLKTVFPAMPLIGVIQPGARLAVKLTKTKRIGVIGTFRTIATNAYKHALLELEAELKVYQKATPLLVPIIEEGLQNKQILHAVLHEYVDEFIAEIDVLILGCTHYPLLTETLRELFPHVQIVDSAVTIAHELVTAFFQPAGNAAGKTFTTAKNTPENANIVLYTNDLNESFVAFAERFFTKPEIVLV